jgi:uncharacterized membrane protein HdeD (DUF308 family)
MLAVYFLLDGFSSVGAALELRPRRGWGWLPFNGTLSLLQVKLQTDALHTASIHW